jgi:hypothetical protein
MRKGGVGREGQGQCAPPFFSGLRTPAPLGFCFSEFFPTARPSISGEASDFPACRR